MVSCHRLTHVNNVKSAVRVEDVVGAEISVNKITEVVPVIGTQNTLVRALEQTLERNSSNKLATRHWVDHKTIQASTHIFHKATTKAR